MSTVRSLEWLLCTAPGIQILMGGLWRINHGKWLICEDFNYWINDPWSKSYSSAYLELLELNNFCELCVISYTHLWSYWQLGLCQWCKLYWRHRINTNRFKDIRSFYDYNKSWSKKTTFLLKGYNFSKIPVITSEIDQCLNELDVSQMSADKLVKRHNSVFTSISERICPQVTKEIIIWDDSSWYDSWVLLLRFSLHIMYFN